MKLKLVGKLVVLLVSISLLTENVFHDLTRVLQLFALRQQRRKQQRQAAAATAGFSSIRKIHQGSGIKYIDPSQQFIRKNISGTDI